MITKEQAEFLDVLEKSLGVVSLALQKTGVKRSEFNEWLENIFFKERFMDTRESSIDYVENQLMKQINDGNIQAITFYLKTIGKERGYN